MSAVVKLFDEVGAIIGSAMGAIELAELVASELLSCSQNSPVVVGSRQTHL